MTLTTGTIWTVIILLGAGTFALRFSFLGLIGDRDLPPWVLRILRYTPVAVIPGLMAPQIFLPAVGATTPDPAKLTAALVCVLIGVWTKNAIFAMGAGVAILALMLWVLG